MLLTCKLTITQKRSTTKEPRLGELRDSTLIKGTGSSMRNSPCVRRARSLAKVSKAGREEDSSLKGGRAEHDSGKGVVCDDAT